MNTFTIDDIRAFRPKPCYDPSRYLPEGWSGTALDILAVEECPAKDRLWVVLRAKCIDSAVLDEFARWCALSVAHLWDMPDVVRRFLETGDESIRAAARVAARDAAWARDTAMDAAWVAARVAARDAARARAVAWSASWVAARDAAMDVARDAARDAAWDAQAAKLREMLR
jgi:hypothetical protein